MSFDPHSDGVYRRHVSHFGEDFTGLGGLGSLGSAVTLCCCGCALLLLLCSHHLSLC